MISLKKGLLFLGMFLGGFWGSEPVMAQSNSSLVLVTSPLPLNLIAEPESTVSANLKIKNGGTETEKLQIGLMKFSAFGDEGLPRLWDKEIGDDYFDWVTFSENVFDLAPNEWKTITMNINVPKEAAFGYYYAVTFSRKDEEIAGGPRSTKIVGASASLVLLEVRVPSAIRKVDVLEFSTPSKFYEFLPVKFNLKLKNDGNVHVAPRGNIFIDGMGKEDLAILSINEVKGNVLPGSNRVFESDWNDGFPVYTDKVVDGKTVTDRLGKVTRELIWDWTQMPKLRWGKFSANMLLVYDDGMRDVPIEGKLSFWVIPWRLIGGGLLVLSLVVIGLYSIFIRPILKLASKKRRNQ